MMSYVDLFQRLDDEQFTVIAASSRLWRPGDAVWPGQHLGDTMHGVPVYSAINGRVAGIQYDIETDEVILSVEASRQNRERVKRVAGEKVRHRDDLTDADQALPDDV